MRFGREPATNWGDETNLVVAFNEQVLLSRHRLQALGRAVVCVLSVLCALGERNMGSVRGHPLGAELQRQAVAEVFAVARARGVPVPRDAEDRIDQTLDRFPDDFFPSVIHDLNHGRRTEMADLGGEIGRLGRLVGVPTPLHDAGTLIVQRAERAS